MKVLIIVLVTASLVLALPEKIDCGEELTVSRTPVFVLIHSPLVGPTTWQSVADEMRRRGFDVVVPNLRTKEGTSVPYWKQHALSVGIALKNIPAGRKLILVAHSGGGMLLPAVRQVTGRRVGAYVFVDAMIPENMKSRLDLFGSLDAATEFRRSAKNGYLPTWTDEDLREDIPDNALRRRFVTELRPLPIAVYEEPIPVFIGWPDAPCGYLQFTPTYDIGRRKAEASGWIYNRMDGGHFHMLFDPQAVTTALIKMVEQMGVAVK